MINISPSTTKIMWGDLNISEMFSIDSTDDFPSSSPFINKLEIMASGESTLVTSVNNDNIVSITVTRSNTISGRKKNDFDLLQHLFKQKIVQRLVITNEDGKALCNYKYAVLQDDKFMLGALSDGQRATTKITWSVANDPS